MESDRRFDPHWIDSSKALTGPSDRPCTPKLTSKLPHDILIYFRDTFSNEIPDYLVRSTYEDNRYKVRRMWWQGVLAVLLDMVEFNEVTDEPIKEEILKLSDHFFATDRYHLTTSEEISRADRVIDLVVSEYELAHPELRDNPPYAIPNPELCL